MIGLIARIMVLDANPLHDPRVANHFGKLLANVRAMQAGRDQNDNALERNARGDERFNHRPQEEMVGHRPRDVANEDAGALASPGEVGQRRRGDRLQQCMSNGGCGISDFFQLALGDQGDVRIRGHVQLKLSAAVQKADRFRD